MKKVFTLFLLCLLGSASLMAQNIIKGKVVDEDNNPLIGASIGVEGSLAGTITDADGNFEFTTAKQFPLIIKVSYLGFVTQSITLNAAGNVNITLVNETQSLQGVTVTAASRFEEDITETPVTIEKVGLNELRSTPAFDAYSSIANLKGVQSNTGSLTFTSVNTRGFADMQNFRFVQLLDGVYANAPGLGYPLGGNSGPADIDIASIELVPGANSALYGANAFNGILTINTKDPFYYQGLSAYLKTGVTVQDAGGTNPLNDFGFRYAKAFNNKFAFKINAGYLIATDWTADDQSHYIGIADVPIADQLLSRSRNDPNFNAVNVYGDEVVVTTDLGGEFGSTPINRTGIREEDIIDYDTEVFKIDGSIHYRITENIEASYGYRFIQSDAILRHTTIYPLRNLQQSIHRFGLKGVNWDLVAFHSIEDAGDSYAMLATGAFIEQGRKSNEAWGADYGAAFRGEVDGITAASHDAARAYADRDLAPIGGDVFNALRTATLTNSDITTGGSKFIDNTTLTGGSANYNFTSFADVLELQVGANYRRYRLISEGQLFNDGPQGFNELIPIVEWGAFIQVGKKLFNERLNLRGSIRGDKHSQFDLVFTPRVSAVLGLDKDRKHNLRASFQTGFRNPSPQEGYINLDVGSAIIIGGFEDNFQNYTVNGINGADIHAGLVTLGSFLQFLGTGGTDPSILQLANLDYLKQEKNTTWDFGYKGLIADKLLIDFNFYHTTYEDLVVRVSTASPQAGRVYLVYTNVDEDVTSYGAGLSLEYLLPQGLRAGFNYTFTEFDADEAVENNPGFLPSFNTPQNRFNVSLSGSDVGGSNFGFNVKFKYWDDYVWQSPFGQGNIESAGIVDLALNYKLRNLRSMIKFGATNLFNNEYNLVYGGPQIGSIYYISWTYDQIFSR